MTDLLDATLSDPSDFWAMVGALATVAAAFGVVWTLRRFREESGAHKAAGIDWLREFIGSERFNQLVSEVDEAIVQGGGGVAEPVGVTGKTWRCLAIIFADIDTVLDLTQDNFVTKDTFIRLFGSTLARIAARVDQLLKHPETHDDMKRVISHRPEVFRLLKEADKWLKDKKRKSEELMRTLDV